MIHFLVLRVALSSSRREGDLTLLHLWFFLFLFFLEILTSAFLAKRKSTPPKILRVLCASPERKITSMFFSKGWPISVISVFLQKGMFSAFVETYHSQRMCFVGYIYFTLHYANLKGIHPCAFLSHAIFFKMSSR